MGRDRNTCKSKVVQVREKYVKAYLVIAPDLDVEFVFILKLAQREHL